MFPRIVIERNELLRMSGAQALQYVNSDSNQKSKNSEYHINCHFARKKIAKITQIHLVGTVSNHITGHEPAICHVKTQIADNIDTINDDVQNVFG